MPKPSITMQSRLSAFPTRGLDVRDEAEIQWDSRHIPFIHARCVEDAPYLIGLVHAHLRLGQMELLKRIAQGRLAEMGGPLLRRADHAIRALDLGRAAPAVVETMDPEARAWITRYVRGVNDFKQRTPPPPDCRTLGVDPAEPWTLIDAVTVGRLASADVNWGKWISLLPLRRQRGYDDYAARLRAFAEAATPTFGPGTPTPLDVLLDVGKTGSNAFAVSGARSATGAALLAGDPHLGLPQPNIWCILGYRTPEGGVLGLTIPGVPFVLVGRNDHIAWGGTNMHSLSSILYDVSSETLTERIHQVQSRWWPGAKRRVRESSVGPVITDAPMFRRLADGPAALRWRGHDPSDEARAMLALSRARTFDEFRQAFATWSTGGQNFLYADRHGDIGQILAVEYQPAAGRAAHRQVVSPDDAEFAWAEGVPSTGLPCALNPDEGFLVSANNTPVSLAPPVLAFGNTNDRVHRLTERLAALETVSVDDLRELQRDVYSASSHKAAEAIASRAARPSSIIDLLRDWDGCYYGDSTGALAYQLMIRRLVAVAYRPHYARRIIAHLLRGPHVHEFLREDIDAGRIDARAVDAAAARVARRWSPSRTWGDHHRIGLTHPIGRVPILGRPWRFGDEPTGGSSMTVHKSNHAITDRPHTVRFGACARHVFDMADPDENYFVLLGGQDGWIGSDTMLDQMPLWRSGKMIRLPLTPDAQRRCAVVVMTLLPG